MIGGIPTCSTGGFTARRYDDGVAYCPACGWEVHGAADLGGDLGDAGAFALAERFGVEAEPGGAEAREQRVAELRVTERPAPDLLGGADVLPQVLHHLVLELVVGDACDRQV